MTADAPSRALPARITIREVGPRDGLQAEAPLPPEARAHLIDALSRTGVSKIEAVSFVSPTAVPAMAGAAEVWALVTRTPGVAYSALVPNRRGAEAAVTAGGFASLQAFIAASDGYNTKNVGKTVEGSMADVADVVEVGRTAGIEVDVSVSAAFGDPYEGDVAPDRVLAVTERLLEIGVAGISLGDTTGMATPKRVRQVVKLLYDTLGTGLRLNLHLHDTQGTAMANVLAALEMGVTEFDASVGGLGGSPFAPGSNGNVATEDLVRMLGGMGIETGIDLERVVEAAHVAEALVGRELLEGAAKPGRPPGANG